MHLKTKASCFPGPCPQPIEDPVARKVVAIAMSITISTRMKLNDMRTQRLGNCKLNRTCLDEQRDTDPRRHELADERSEMIVLSGDIQPTLGRTLLAPLRNQANSMGPMAQCDGKHLRSGRHLEIERASHAMGKTFDIGVADMPSILAQMRSYAIGSSLDRHQRRSQRIGVSSTARIADGGHMVNVHAEPQVW
jgi:hypothetical protein